MGVWTVLLYDLFYCLFDALPEQLMEKREDCKSCCSGRVDGIASGGNMWCIPALGQVSMHKYMQLYMYTYNIYI